MYTSLIVHKYYNLHKSRMLIEGREGGMLLLNQFTDLEHKRALIIIESSQMFMLSW